MAPRSKGEIALDELDRLTAAGVRFGTVLADAGYGASAAFRQGLDARELLWAVGIPRNQKVYSAAVQLVPPQGRARKPVPDEEPLKAERSWPGSPGAASLGGRAARVHSPPGSPRPASGSAMGRSGATTGTCRGMRSG